MEKDLEKQNLINLDPSSSMLGNNHDHTKGRQWIVHGLVFVFICSISAGVGVATFFGQRATELALFQTQFDGTIQQVQGTLQFGLSQKFAASRLLNKVVHVAFLLQYPLHSLIPIHSCTISSLQLYAYAAKYGYGTTFGQSPPYFTLPGMQNISAELYLLGGNLRGTEWHPLVTNDTRSAWETWAKQNIAVQTKGLAPNIFKTINTTAYKYGICNKTSATTYARVSGTIVGGDPRFQHWLFPIWQGISIPLSPSSIL